MKCAIETLLTLEKIHGIGGATAATLRDCGIDLEVVERKLRAKAIVRFAAKYHDVKYSAFLGSRRRDVSAMRFTAMWAMRHSGLVWREIAEAFGMSDHTSAIYGVATVDGDARLLAQAREILAGCGGVAAEMRAA